MNRWMLTALPLAFAFGCAGARTPTEPMNAPEEPPAASLAPQPADALVADRAVAIGYSGFREGQHPDRGDGAVLPTKAEISEDLHILLDHGFDLIRLYDSGDNSRHVLEVIRDERLPVRVVLGAWLQAELSAHETCAWLDEPIPDDVLQAHRAANAEELQRTIDLARDHASTVVAVNVGNEALVTWNDHLVSIEAMVGYLQQVAKAIEQPVTTADNYLAWVEHADRLAPVVDFAMVHSYPVWEGKAVEDGIGFTVANLLQVQKALPETPLAIGEAGWATVAVEFPEQASEANQTRYVNELIELARSHNITTFIFEAFDEPWKGHVANERGAEKHWGLFDVGRKPKAVMKDGGPLRSDVR